MEDYDIDLPAETLLAWIHGEHKAGGPLQMSSSREYVSVPRRRADRSSFDEQDDLAESVSAGNLDVQPLAAGAVCTLRFGIEDEPAAHTPEDSSAPT